MDDILKKNFILYLVFKNIFILSLVCLGMLVFILYTITSLNIYQKIKTSHYKNIQAKIESKDCSSNICIYTGSYKIGDQYYKENIKGISKPYEIGDKIDITYSEDEPNQIWEVGWKDKNLSLIPLTFLGYTLLALVILTIITGCSLSNLGGNLLKSIRSVYSL